MGTFEYFRRALQDYMKRNSVTQKVLSIDADVPRSAISEILNGKREPGLRIQEKIVKCTGYELCDFLTRGRSLLDGESPPPEDPPPNVQFFSLRDCIINEFQDEETALSINAMLLKLEKEDLEKYRQVEGYIQAMCDTVKLQKKTPSNG